MESEAEKKKGGNKKHRRFYLRWKLFVLSVYLLILAIDVRIWEDPLFFLKLEIWNDPMIVFLSLLLLSLFGMLMWIVLTNYTSNGHEQV